MSTSQTPLRSLRLWSMPSSTAAFLPSSTFLIMALMCISNAPRGTSLFFIQLQFLEFLLQGRFIFGPDVRSLFLTIFLILAPVLVFCIFVASHLINDFPDHWGISVMVVVVVFTVYDLTLLLLTSGRDPGIVPRNTHPPEPEPSDLNNDTGNGRLCVLLHLGRATSLEL